MRSNHQLARSPGSGPAARLGAVAYTHRFGSALNLHLHFHCVVIKAVAAIRISVSREAAQVGKTQSM